MKITKRIPRPRGGRADESKKAIREEIRRAYTQGPQKEVRIIPAKKDLIGEDANKNLRVCAYCRVSTEEDSQGTSYELQVQNYTQMINEHEGWEFAGIYADEGISGTSILHRESFLQMIEHCKEGKIDLIVTKQVSRFARNVLDTLSYIRLLRTLEPPVGIYFESEKLNTLDPSSDMIITVLSLVAQSESEQKSKSIKWAYKRRWSKGVGINPNWALLGFEDDWEINEDEGEIIRIIFALYLDGYTGQQIADELTKHEIPTVKGNTVWSAGSVMNILKNEKYCGDVLCQKTVTIDFFTHKTVKNDGHEPQYFIEGHHPAIVPKVDWLKVQQIRKERRYCKRGRRKRKPKAIVRGQLAGFIIAEYDWDEEFVNSYLEQVMLNAQETPTKESLEDENFIIENEKE